MKKLVLALALLSLPACTTNGQYDSGKTWLLVGTVVVGSIALSGGGSSSEDDCPHPGWDTSGGVSVKTCGGGIPVP